MHISIALILTVIAIYCAVMYGYLGYRAIRYREDRELETFHLGLCFILAIGFLGLGA